MRNCLLAYISIGSVPNTLINNEVLEINEYAGLRQGVESPPSYPTATMFIVNPKSFFEKLHPYLCEKIGGKILSHPDDLYPTGRCPDK